MFLLSYISKLLFVGKGLQVFIEERIKKGQNIQFIACCRTCSKQIGQASGGTLEEMHRS